MPDRTALYPGLGKVIAIGMWNLEQERGLILLEGDEEEPQHEWERVAHSDVYRSNERGLLERLSDPEWLSARGLALSAQAVEAARPI